MQKKKKKMKERARRWKKKNTGQREKWKNKNTDRSCIVAYNWTRFSASMKKRVSSRDRNSGPCTVSRLSIYCSICKISVEKLASRNIDQPTTVRNPIRANKRKKQESTMRSVTHFSFCLVRQWNGEFQYFSHSFLYRSTEVCTVWMWFTCDKSEDSQLHRRKKIILADRSIDVRVRCPSQEQQWWGKT